MQLIGHSVYTFFICHRILKLTVEQKCDIATRELDELREELQRKKDEMERSHDNHKVLVFSAHTNVIIT